MYKYVWTTEYEQIDTNILYPHQECYFIKNGELYSEQIDGSYFSLGTIIKVSNDLIEFIYVGGDNCEF